MCEKARTIYTGFRRQYRPVGHRMACRSSRTTPEHVDVWDVRRWAGAVRQIRFYRPVFKNPAGSGPVSCVAAFPDGQHIAW